MKKISRLKLEKRLDPSISKPVKVYEDDETLSAETCSTRSEESSLDLHGINSMVEWQDILGAVADSRNRSD